MKPYVKTNKNDESDAEAIAEAVGARVWVLYPIKTDDQLDLQSLHRVRERWVSGRTAVINQIRGLLLERGITIRKGRRHISTREYQLDQSSPLPATAAADLVLDRKGRLAHLDRSLHIN